MTSVVQWALGRRSELFNNIGGKHETGINRTEMAGGWKADLPEYWAEMNVWTGEIMKSSVTMGVLSCRHAASKFL